MPKLRVWFEPGGDSDDCLCFEFSVSTTLAALVVSAVLLSAMIWAITRRW